MNNYSLTVFESFHDIDEVLYQVIQMNILWQDGKFFHSAQGLFVDVINTNLQVNSFITMLSGNQKEIIAIFTTDAFDDFTSNVTIEFGYGDFPKGAFENIDIHSITEPLDSVIVAPLADNAWLDSLV